MLRFLANVSDLLIMLDENFDPQRLYSYGHPHFWADIHEQLFDFAIVILLLTKVTYQS